MINLVMENDVIVYIYIHVNTSDLRTADWTSTSPFSVNIICNINIYGLFIYLMMFS
jgi:hypothetical protein